MTCLLDTTALSDLMRENPAFDKHLAGLGETDLIAICPVVRGEIQFGLEKLEPGRRRLKLETKAKQLFSVIHCEPIASAAADHYAKVKVARQKKGLTLDENDLWIAACAPASQATLVSRDGDFRQIDGLAVEDWTK
jgi:predicted nucleic acid-binding protein